MEVDSAFKRTYHDKKNYWRREFVPLLYEKIEKDIFS